MLFNTATLKSYKYFFQYRIEKKPIITPVSKEEDQR